MFESTADVSEVSAEEIITRDAKRYQVRGGQEICIAQVEVVGKALLERKDELLEAMREGARGQGPGALRADGHRRAREGTEMLVAGDVAAVARSLGVEHPTARSSCPA